MNEEDMTPFLRGGWWNEEDLTPFLLLPPSG